MASVISLSCCWQYLRSFWLSIFGVHYQGHFPQVAQLTPFIFSSAISARTILLCNVHHRYKHAAGGCNIAVAGYAMSGAAGAICHQASLVLAAFVL